MLIRFVLYLTSTNLRLLRWISSFCVCVCVWFRWYTIFHILIHDCFGAFSLLSLFLPMSLGSGGQIHVRTPYFDSCCSNTQNKSQSLYQSKDVSDGCFFLFNRQISIHFQFPIPIGNNRFYRKWFEEPSTLFDSTRHSEFTDRNLLIDLPFSTSLSLALFLLHHHTTFYTRHTIHSLQCYWTFTDRHTVDASTKVSLTSMFNSEAQSTHRKKRTETATMKINRISSLPA